MSKRAVRDFEKSAEKYVVEQLAIMEKYGSRPVLSDAEFKALVEEITEVGKKLWLASGGLIGGQEILTGQEE